MFWDVVGQFLDLGTVCTAGALQECTEPTVTSDWSARANAGDVITVIVPSVAVDAGDSMGKLSSYLVVAKRVAIGGTSAVDSKSSTCGRGQGQSQKNEVKDR
jgi:hypothetical protein